MSYTRIYGAPSNAIKWQLGFNSAFKGLICKLNSTITNYKASTKHTNTTQKQYK